MYVHVRVTPKAKRERVECIQPASFEIAVKEPAERNLANTRIREIIAEHFSVSPKAVRIVSGHQSPKKVLSVDEGEVL